MNKPMLAHRFNRRTMLTISLGSAVGFAVLGSSKNLLAQNSDAVPLDVYKDPSCGCCANWIEHIEQSGFAPTIYHPADLNALKLEHGIRAELQSCHTAITQSGFAFEGHVPAKFIQQFLASPPVNAKGLTAPGMPMGSPGMEVGDQFTPYDVVLFNKDGSTSVYASIKSAKDQF